MAPLLLFLVCVFAALSSSSAAALGLESARILMFSALVASLAALPFLRRRALPEPEGLFTALALLLLMIAVEDAALGRLDVIDYKVVLPVLVLGAAPELARELARLDLGRFVWRLLSLYVVGTFLYEQVAEPAVVARGYAGIVRYDPVGSVVMHASLSMIHLLLAITRLATRERVTALMLGVIALLMVMSSATRTVLVSLAFFAFFFTATAGNRQAAARAMAAACLGLGAAFALYTLFVSDSFLLRLTSGEVADYGSGRLPSVGYWLGLMGDHPWGLGFGAIRELMADGKPYLDGESTLEWPHNEYVRFYVEAGPLGLLFVLLLIAGLVRLALLAAARCEEPERRVLLLAIAADLLAESLLQNLLNAIYHATVLIVLLVVAARPAPGTRSATVLAAGSKV